MSKTWGVLFMFAGLGLAAYVLVPADKPTASSTDEFDIRLTQGVPTKTEAVRPPRPSPSGALARSGALEQPVTDGSHTGLSAPAVVTVSPHPRSSVRLAVNPTSTPGVLPTDRTQLARELQRELRRVGCYE